MIALFMIKINSSEQMSHYAQSHSGVKRTVREIYDGFKVAVLVNLVPYAFPHFLFSKVGSTRSDYECLYEKNIPTITGIVGTIIGSYAFYEQVIFYIDHPATMLIPVTTNLVSLIIDDYRSRDRKIGPFEGIL